jgi:hypothetical protein
MKLSIDASSSSSSSMILGHMQGNERPIIVDFLIGLDIVLVCDDQQQDHAGNSEDDEISLSVYTTGDDSSLLELEEHLLLARNLLSDTMIPDGVFSSDDDSSSSSSSMSTIEFDSRFENDSLKLAKARRLRLLPVSSFANDASVVNAMETTTMVVLKLQGSPDDDKVKSSHTTPPAAVAAPDFLSTMKSLRIRSSAAYSSRQGFIRSS